MLPNFVEANFDKIASVGSYYIASAAFVLTIAALLVTAIGLYINLKQTAVLKAVEVEQKKFENALDLIRILSGVKDNYRDGSNSNFLQIAAMESLQYYPEYNEVYKNVLKYYRDLPKKTRQIQNSSMRL